MYRPLPNQHFLLFAIAVFILSGGYPCAGAGTPAGTVITGWSNVILFDAQGGVQGTVQSNVSSMTVEQHAQVSITPPARVVFGEAGRSTTVPAEMRNLGNSTDTFVVAAQADVGWQAQVYVDSNGDGLLQPTETSILGASPPLPPDSMLKLLIKVDVPANASSGSNGTINILAASASDPSATTSASITVSADEATPIIILSGPTAPVKLGSPFTLNTQLVPARQTDLDVLAVAPDGEQTPYVVHTNASGAGTLNIDADVSGLWSISASWSGDQTSAGASGFIEINCEGPTYEVSGLDMITVPMQVASGSPFELYDGHTAFALAKWLPSNGRYATFEPFGGTIADTGLQQLYPGEGYWIVTSGVMTIAPIGRLVNQKQPFTLSLEAGWNQIGSPYLNPIDWGSTQVIYNGATLSLTEAATQGIMPNYCWQFVTVGNFIGYGLIHATLPGAKTTLDPWKGCWVYLAKPAQIVFAPPAEAAATATFMSAGAASDTDADFAARRRRRPRPAPITASSSTEWVVALASTCGNITDSANYIGVTKDSTLYAMANPPRSGNFEDLYLTTSEGAAGTGLFASDMRAEITKPETFNVEVAGTDISNVHTLSWIGMEKVQPGYSFTLKDLQTGKTCNMRSYSSYNFYLRSPDTPARFEVIVTADNSVIR